MRSSGCDHSKASICLDISNDHKCLDTNSRQAFGWPKDSIARNNTRYYNKNALSTTMRLSIEEVFLDVIQSSASVRAASNVSDSADQSENVGASAALSKANNSVTT